MANRREFATLAAGLVAVVAATFLLRPVGVAHPTTVALTLLLIVLFVAAAGVLWTAIVTSLAAILCFNYFFLPPVGTWDIAGPENWVALAALLVTSIVASQLSARARARMDEANLRRTELARLFELTRDMLLVSDDRELMPALARHIAHRFEIRRIAIALPLPSGDWTLHQGGPEEASPDGAHLQQALAGGHAPNIARSVALAPVRIADRRVGVLAVDAGALEFTTLEAIAGIAAVAFERSEFIAERRSADLAHERAELASALLAAIGHDLRTPLTALRVAVANASSEDLAPSARAEQAALASAQAAHLSHLFDEILDMARIETKSIRAERVWSSPAEIVEAAMAHARASIERHNIEVDVAHGVDVNLDPRLTAAALAHFIENAARYSPEGSTIEVRAWMDADGLCASVSDRGPGLDESELESIFTPLYRGRAGRSTPGTGMGLAITRGLLAAEGGRAWAEKADDRGARFLLAVPCPIREGVGVGEPS